MDSKKIKDSIPEPIRNLGRYVKSANRYRQFSNAYKQGVDYVNKKNPEKKTLIFVINFPQAWSSVKSVYDEAKKRDDLNVLVFAVPRLLKSLEDDTVGIAERKNEAYEFFKGTDIDVIKANTEDGRWLDLKDYNPDYVIYIRPYNDYAPAIYRSYYVCKFAKLFYVPYAYGMLGDKMLSVVLPESFTFTMHRIFFPNDSRRVQFAKEQPFYRRRSLSDRFRYMGFPRFDFSKRAEENRNYDERSFTVSWMPRWAADDKFNQKTSHFLTYYKDFLKYFEEHRDINLIIRPHPLMFSSYVSTGIMTEEEVNEFKEICKQAPNIEIDERKDYSKTLEDSDLLVADYTSLIAEFFMMEKPIIFCDTVDGLNVEGQKICGSLYKEDSFEKIVDRIESVKNGNDENKATRVALIKELLPGKTGEIGKNILEEIINS